MHARSQQPESDEPVGASRSHSHRRAARGGGEVRGTLSGRVAAVSPAGLLALQRLVGNAAVTKLAEEYREEQVPPSGVHDVLRSAGRPMEPEVRGEMEERLGTDFSDVRIHSDTTARRSAAAVGARAYTSGNHIVIGEGRLEKRTLAHELTHVIQQRQGPVAGTEAAGGLRISDPADRFEREAEATAAAVMSGPLPVQQTTDVRAPDTHGRTSEGTTRSALVQRAVKESIPQPDAAARSADVPDLPTDLVERIQAARAQPERRDVLSDLVNHIWARLKDLQLDDEQTELQGNLESRVEVGYIHRRTGPGNAMALTAEQLGVGPDPDSPPIKITIYRDAFDQGAAVLYSTVRHELIHAAQRSMVPDEGQAADTDEFMFEDLYEKDTGVTTRKTLQLPMQEIETHVWELTHAGETGVNETYRGDTVTYLVRYANELVEGVNQATAKEFTYWVNYLNKAVELLNEAADAVDELPDARSEIEEAASDLTKAITARSAKRRKTDR